MPKSLLSELIADASSPRLLPALSMGLVAGMLLVTIEVSFAAMIYSCELSSLAPGEVIAPLAVLGDYTAVTDFRAGTDCKTACLSAESYRSVELKDPALALHRLLIRSACRE